MVRIQLIITSAFVAMTSYALAGPYAPAAGQPGSTAIAATSVSFVGWATTAINLTRGRQDISNPSSPLASYGTAADALGPAGTNSGAVVSLGDAGSMTVGFANAITNGPGADFAVFENGFADTFLELAFVEVSSDGTNFFRFPSVSLTPTTTQVGSFGTLDPTNLYDLAGKYRVGFGTPFDLQELVGVSGLLDVNYVRFVRVVDVVGSIASPYATSDSLGNLINDPWKTSFGSGGFDLDGVGAIHTVPEPSAFSMLLVGGLALAFRRGKGGSPAKVAARNAESLSRNTRI